MTWNVEPTVHAHSHPRKTSSEPKWATEGSVVEASRLVKAKVRSLLHGHLNWLERTALGDRCRTGLAVTRSLLGACHAAVRCSAQDINGSAAHVLSRLSRHWPGALPSDPTFRALRAALGRLAMLSPFVRRSRLGWCISVGLARCMDVDDPRLALLTKAEILRDSGLDAGFRQAAEQQILLISATDAQDSSRNTHKERARASSGDGRGFLSRAAWLAAAGRTGRVWGRVTADLLSSIRSPRGNARDVAATLLSSRRCTRSRKWAQRPFTNNERVGVARALERLVAAGLVTKDGDRWRVPKVAKPEVDRDLFEADVEALSLEFERVEDSQPDPPCPAIAVLRAEAERRGWRIGSDRALAQLDLVLKERKATIGSPAADGGDYWRYVLEQYGARARYVAPYLAAVLAAPADQETLDMPPAPMQTVRANPAPVADPRPPIERPWMLEAAKRASAWGPRPREQRTA